MAFTVMSQFGTAASPGTVYYCDDKADLDRIKNPKMGDTALVIHENGAVYMADSTGTWCQI